ncbi:hypothetical protein PLICRDRAFT_460757 [Plicaturopsis crispa FD-325 SS-3]|nr:hypothetical protein PLICRDRAFT_460757 [Plicaturopsis crispa FD-325 SS-3]
MRGRRSKGAHSSQKGGKRRDRPTLRWTDLEFTESDELAMPPSLRDIAARAIGGSCEAILELELALDPDINPDAKCYNIKFLPIFLLYLNGPKLALNPSRDSPIAAAAYGSLRFITRLIYAHNLTRSDADAPVKSNAARFLAIFGPCWPEIWEWIQYLENNHLLLNPDVQSLPSPLPADMLYQHASIMRLLAAFVVPENSYFTALFHPNDVFLKFIIRIWVYEAKLPEFDGTGCTWVLGTLLPMRDTEREFWSTEMGNAVGGNLEELASLALCRLDTYMRGRLSPDNLVFLFHMAIITSVTDDCEILAAFLSQNATNIITRLFSYCTTSHGMLNPTILSTMHYLCLAFIIKAFDIKHKFGSSQVHISLEASLLPTLLRCTEMTSSARVTSFCITLAKCILPPFLVSRSLVSTSIMSLVGDDSLDTTLDILLSHEVARAPTSLQEIWRDFWLLATRRYQLRMTVDIACETVLCTNEACNRAGRADLFKKCSTCADTYCSRDCQKADWRNGHRAKCKLNRVSFSGNGSRMHLSRRDFAFLEAIVWKDWCTHQNSNPISALTAPTEVWCFDYTQTSSPDISTGTLFEDTARMREEFTPKMAQWLQDFYQVCKIEFARYIVVFSTFRYGRSYMIVPFWFTRSPLVGPGL